MSLFDCLETAVSAGDMDAARGRQAQAVFARLHGWYRESMGDAAAQAKAAAETRRIMAAKLAEDRRRRLLEVAVARRVDADLARFGDPERPDLAVAALIDRDDRAPYASVETRRKALRGLYHARMDELLRRGRMRIGGRPGDPDWMMRVVRESFGEATGDASAAAAAKAWSETADLARRNFNAAGGSVGRLDRWGMPQAHDSLKVRRVSAADWTREILPLLDLERMKQRIADGVFDSPDMEPRAVDLDQAVRDGIAASYRTIVTEGYDKVDPSGTPMGAALAKRHADRRFLIFKDADSWLTYQAKYGSDPFSAMMAHIDVLARDTALLQILGPNPTATVQRLQQRVLKDAATRDAAAGGTRQMGHATRSMKLVDDMLAMYGGTSNTPVGGPVARIFMGVRNTLQAAQLGSAALSAISDLNFQRIAASDAGLSQTRLMKRLAGQLDPRNAEDRAIAVRSGLIAEDWANMASAQERYVGEVIGPEWSRVLADGVMRVSGLSAWTQAGRWAFGMEFMGTLADAAGRGFDALPAPLRRTMERYGIDAAGWDRARAAGLYDHKGAKFLRPDEIGAADQDLGLRFLEMIQGETEYAVPSTSLRGRATFLSDVRPGTFAGELLRSSLMYKNFSITLWQTHLRRLWQRPDWSGRAGGAVNLLLGGALMGALSLQLKQVASGRDPRDADTPAFWAAATMQGGGLGIFGDFFFTDINRFGGGLPETLAGPVASAGADAINLTAGNLLQAVQGDDTKAGRELVQFLRFYTPGSSLWYSRLAVDRLVWDQLQWLADPKAGQAFRRKEQFWRSEFGQKHYWRPGRTLPGRAPAIIGEAR